MIEVIQKRRRALPELTLSTFVEMEQLSSHQFMVC
jgi:hypothetical protein